MNAFAKIFQNRIVLAVICIVIAAVICFVLTPIYNRELARTADVVVVAADIPQGEMITEDMLEVRSVGAYNLPGNLAERKEQVAGAYAAVPIHAGDFVTPAKIAREAPHRNGYLRALDGGHVAVSVTIPYFAAGLSDKLASGDIITVIAGGTGADNQTIIPAELTYVEVIAVSDRSGADFDNEFGLGANEENIATVTLLATPRQARLLVDIEQNAALHAALAFRGDREAASAFLAAQSETLALIDEGLIEETVIVPVKGEAAGASILSDAEREQLERLYNDMSESNEAIRERGLN